MRTLSILRMYLPPAAQPQAADAETTVPDDKDDLLSRPSKLSSDRHADAVANGCERARVENLAGEASVEPLRHPAAHREAIDHDGCVRIHHFTKLPRNPCGMYGYVVVMLLLLFDDYSIKVSPHVGDLLEPVRWLSRFQSLARARRKAAGE